MRSISEEILSFGPDRLRKTQSIKWSGINRRRYSLVNDKIFGLPINEVQKHLSQTPAPVKVNVSLSGNNYKRGSSSSARGSSFPSQDKRRKVIIDEGNKGGPKKFSVPRSLRK
jgi:hypothetical protein